MKSPRLLFLNFLPLSLFAVLPRPSCAFVVRALLQLVVVTGLVAEQNTCFSANEANPMVHQNGIHLVDAHGKPVALRGVNLGRLAPVGGMDVRRARIFRPSPPRETWQFSDALTKLAGAPATATFRRRIYDGFITKEDIARIAHSGFNTVRVPINYRALKPGNVGWQKLDELVGWCREYGLFVVLDLHSAPGRTVDDLECGS